MCLDQHGRVLDKIISGDDSPRAWMAGAALYYVYAAVIHVFFWMPCVFPKHTRPDASPFFPFGLLYLTIISIGWFVLYEVFGDVSGFCVLHFITDFWATFNMGLQGPDLLSRLGSEMDPMLVSMKRN